MAKRQRAVIDDKKAFHPVKKIGKSGDMSNEPVLAIDWASGQAADEALRIGATLGAMPLEIVIYSTEVMAASQRTDDDFLERIGGMQPWLEDAITQALFSGRVFDEGAAPDLPKTLLVMRQDFDLTGDRIVGPRPPPA